MEFGPFQIVSGAILILLALIIIALTLVQTQKQQNLGSAFGAENTDNYFGKGGDVTNRKDAALARLTKIFGVIFFLAVLGVNVMATILTNAANAA
jgi:preprotein translocase subunit SecG